MNGYWDFRAVGVIHGRTYTDTETSIMVDNTAPVPALSVPAGPLTGTVNVTADAPDAHSGTASVKFEYRRSGVSTWTTCTTDFGAPFACSLNTTSLTDGNYEFRATATDNVGNSAVTGTTTRIIKNNSIDLVNNDAAVRGTVLMNATWNGPGTPTVYFQGSENANGPWDPICTDGSLPYACSIDTTYLDSQRWYVRVMTNSNDLVYDEVVTTIVDNETPDVTLTVPPAPLRGTISLTAAADDTDSNPGDESSGVANVRFEYRKGGPGNPWLTCGTDNSAPYACSLDTTSLTTGNHEFRAIATDNAGNSTTTNMTPREVNNSPTATITAPTGGPGTTYSLGSTITVSADAWALNGVASVRFEYAVPGSPGTWYTICTDNLAPFTCGWNTAGRTAGNHAVRAFVTAVGGATGTSNMTP